MNTIFKKCAFLIVSLIALLFSSCEKDLYENAIQQDHIAIIQRISLNEIENLKLNEKLIETVNKIKSKKIENKHGKFVYNPQFNFYIDDEKGLYIEKDGVKSYTFQILRENSSDKIENIVFNQNAEQFDVYINKYTLPQSDIENLERNQFINFTASQIESTQIYSNRVTDCVWHVIHVTDNGDGSQTIEWQCTGSSGSSGNSGSGTNSTGNSGTYTTTGSNSSSSTTNSGGTTTGNYDPIGNSSSPTNINNTGTGTTTSGGGSNTSGNNSSGYTPPATVITTPIASPISREEALLRNTFKNQLIPQQLTFFNSLTNIERSNFYNFLTTNSLTQEQVDNGDYEITEYSSSAVIFASEIITLAINEPNQADVTNLIGLSLALETNNNNIFGDNFPASIDNFVDLDLTNPPSTFNPYSLGLRVFLDYRKVRSLNPEWSRG